jgi:transposase, IS5 family
VRWLRAVIDQTERRVLRGAAVPAEETIVSVFEPHTDIIIKDCRKTYHGHEVTLTGGTSGLIRDPVIESGNPADSTRGALHAGAAACGLRQGAPPGEFRRRIRLPGKRGGG